MPSRISSGAIATLAIIAALAARPVDHLELKRSEPSADTTLTAAPRLIRFWFSEDPDLSLMTVKLKDSKDATVTISPLRWEEKKEGAPVVTDITASLGAGHYTVEWRAMSDDGHAVTGEIPFTVAAQMGQRDR